MLYTHYVRSATQFDALKRAQTIPRLNDRLPFRVKMRNTRTEQMFSASPPTTDMRWMHRNDRFVPKD